jgi:hypothetical protein
MHQTAMKTVLRRPSILKFIYVVSSIDRFDNEDLNNRQRIVKPPILKNIWSGRHYMPIIGNRFAGAMGHFFFQARRPFEPLI